LRFRYRALLFCPFLAGASLSGPGAVRAAETEILRRILIIYDGTEESHDPRRTAFHKTGEMPLHYLGLDTRWWDADRGIPGEEELAGTRGLLLVFGDGKLAAADRFASFIVRELGRGKKILFLGGFGFLEDRSGFPVPEGILGKLRKLTGLTWGWEGGPLPRRWRISGKDRRLVDFERPYRALRPSVFAVSSSGENEVALSVVPAENPGIESDLIVFGRWGAFAASEAVFDTGGGDYTFWRVDPFLFYKKAFGLSDEPAFDTTTLNGERIFFSHIDGDGLLNVSEVRYQALSGEIIRDRILRKFRFPFSVSFIVAHFDPGLVPVPSIPHHRAVAESILSLPNVEPASHTFSHPFNWRLAASEDAAGKDPEKKYTLKVRGYERTSLQREIDYSIAYVDLLSPRGKDARLFLWSGDCLPTEEAVRRTWRIHLWNMNGGDTRFDALNPTLTMVSPLYGQIGDVWQCYTGQANENIYTSLWTGPFWGFGYVTETFERTGAPRRLKPVNVYYHFYIGEKRAALRSLEEIFKWCEHRELCPIFGSEYVRIVQGFRTGRIGRVGEEAYRVHDNGFCRTVRFDGGGKVVDMLLSEGVLGWRRVGDRLYVALDEGPSHLICLGERSRGVFLERANVILSRVRMTEKRIAFRARIFLPAEVRFGGLLPGSVFDLLLDRSPAGSFVVDERGFLGVSFDGPVGGEREVSLVRREEKR